MVKIQKKNEQYFLTIPRTTAEFVELEVREEVMIVPMGKNNDLLIKRKQKKEKIDDKTKSEDDNK